MNTIKKTVESLLNNPKSLKYKEIAKALRFLGFQMIKAKGSHKKFKHPVLKLDLIIPVHNNDCKDFYKILASKIANKL